MSKKFISLLIFIFATFSILPLIAQDGLHVSVVNLRNNKGNVLVSLFRECSGYPGQPENAFRKTQVTITNKTAIAVFPGLPAGNYSIAILHDENDDKKMNTNFFGIPKEGYGFSNNVMGALGPPSCNRASFRYMANAGTRVVILARYGW